MANLRLHAKAADLLLQHGQTLLGIVIVLVPLALWVSWSKEGYYAILIVGAAAAALLCILGFLHSPQARRRRSYRVQPGTSGSGVPEIRRQPSDDVPGRHMNSLGDARKLAQERNAGSEKPGDQIWRQPDAPGRETGEADKLSRPELIGLLIFGLGVVVALWAIVQFLAG